MCGIAAGLMATGAAISAVASVKNGIDQKNAANQAARDTLDAAQREAGDRLQRAAIDQGDIAAKASAIAATQTAAQGGSNVSGGTTDAVQRISNINAARDEAAVQSNAAREAWGIQGQAKRQADALKKQGKAAFVNGILGGAGSIIGGAGSAIASYNSGAKTSTTKGIP